MKHTTIIIIFFITTILINTNIFASATEDGELLEHSSAEYITKTYLSGTNPADIDYTDPEVQSVYNKFYDAIKNHDVYITFPNTDSHTFSTLLNIFNRFYIEHSEYQDYIDLSQFDDLGDYSLFVFSYTYSKEDQENFDRRLDRIINDVITPDMTELQKEMAIHDYIVLNCSYDHELKASSHSAYSLIMNHTAVCDGYAKSMNCLLNRIGIKCISSTSIGMKHAWNIVTIGGKTYNVDATWDDADDGTKIRYSYFNQSDSSFLQKKHSWTPDEHYITCSSTDYSYFDNLMEYFRLGNEIYFNYGNCQPLYKSDMKNGLNLNNSVFISDKVDELVYFNGWIYCTKCKNLANVYRVNLSNPSQEEIMAANVYPSSIYVQAGIVHYYDGTINLKDQVRIPEYNKFDLNGDNEVSAADLAELCSHYNKSVSSLYCQSNEDFVIDGIIDIYDITRLASNIN